jgi:hypothetical protein
MPYRSVNPASGEVLKTFTEHTDGRTHRSEESNALVMADCLRRI